MKTALMEAYCLEVHDEIMLQGEIYRIYNISDQAPDIFFFYLVDKNGDRAKIEVQEDEKIPLVVVDNLADV